MTRLTTSEMKTVTGLCSKLVLMELATSKPLNLKLGTAQVHLQMKTRGGTSTKTALIGEKSRFLSSEWVVIGFTLLPSLGIPPIVLGVVTGGVLMIPLLAKFTVAGTAVCITVALMIALLFGVYAIEKEKAINSDAYVEIGGYLLGFFLISILSVALAATTA